jgi:hypothetical protein
MCNNTEFLNIAFNNFNTDEKTKGCKSVGVPYVRGVLKNFRVRLSVRSRRKIRDVHTEITDAEIRVFLTQHLMGTRT